MPLKWPLVIKDFGNCGKRSPCEIAQTQTTLRGLGRQGKMRRTTTDNFVSTNFAVKESRKQGQSGCEVRDCGENIRGIRALSMLMVMGQ